MNIEMNSSLVKGYLAQCFYLINRGGTKDLIYEFFERSKFYCFINCTA